MPSSARISKAHNSDCRIEKPGALKDRTFLPEMSSNNFTVSHTSSLKSFLLCAHTGLWIPVWDPISYFSDIFFTMSGYFFAIQPTMKNVAFEPEPSRASRILSVFL